MHPGAEHDQAGGLRGQARGEPVGGVDQVGPGLGGGRRPEDQEHHDAGEQPAGVVQRAGHEAGRERGEQAEDREAGERAGGGDRVAEPVGRGHPDALRAVAGSDGGRDHRLGCRRDGDRAER
ncbi:hypothetical protein GCM10020358_69840 [Amorphoplanes nipponensis]|uniref:Uncharacterized protein n=1 Tax=Actinoplanes nipponensis TaxID=135950 RepID=A0A919MVF8_9ACTN|nr:hypothetical protein Ani05nite_46440 [Actinoplanes nipponensis]